MLQATKLDVLLSTPARFIQILNVDDFGTGKEDPQTDGVNVAGLCLYL